MFVDIAKIEVRGGAGGNGAVAWRREKYEPAGGPAGGDGGYGGSVILIVDPKINTLVDFKYRRHFRAPLGEHGRGKTQYGKKGEHLYVKVPQGTIVKDEETGNIIADMVSPGETFIVAKGGRGGKGNAKFATSTRQAPNFAEAGQKGVEREIILELKLLADVGLCGFPNVGKSTFLSMVSEAKPRIANYHFTTIHPNLGVVRVGDGQSFVMADIPGLIEGAHEGTGLGHEFLRHVERTRILVHIVDVSGSEGRDPYEDFMTINHELVSYNERLGNRPQIVVANKTDLPDAAEKIAEFEEKVRALGYDFYAMSAATGNGVKDLKHAIWHKLQTAEIEEEIVEVVEDTYANNRERDHEITYETIEEVVHVEGVYLEKILMSTNFEDDHSVVYFQRKLRDLGVVETLKSMGTEEEDMIVICGVEFEFFE